MCGIAAIFHGAGGAPPARAIENMTAALIHRGPDQQAVICHPGCDLGHTRLSIIDIAGGTQPMRGRAGRYTLVFNGEIYNYRDLRRELEALGAAFETRSDTEVLLRGYETWGPEVLSRLNGQFAFAVWDATEHALFAARDRFGEKPLYFATDAVGRTLIASEIKSILASELVAPRLDLHSIDEYLALFYVPPDRSIYANISPLRPGHAMQIDASGVRTWRYWQPRLSNLEVDETEAVEEIRARAERAVARQMLADVPLGAFLSGGLDSSTIVALMGRRSAAAVRTFAVGFGDLIDELPFARDVAAAYQTDHHEIQANVDVPAMLQQMLDVYDEPFGDSSNIPTYLVAQFARRHVKVVLNGDGGDEIFGGYSWYVPLRDEPDSAAPLWDRHLANSSHAALESAHLWKSPKRAKALDALRGRYAPGDSVQGLDHAVDFDLNCYLPGDILTKVDRAAMAHGLETRAPFLDVDLADFVLGLPSRMRFGKSGGSLKRLLRQACGELWPASVRSRGKQGFGAPVRRWLEMPDVARMWQAVACAGSPLAAVLPGVSEPNLELRPQRKWTLLCLGLWLERNRQCLANANLP